MSTFPIKMVPINLIDIPSFHHNRDPVFSKERLTKLKNHLANSGGSFDAELGAGCIVCGPKESGRYDLIDGVGRKWMAEHASNPQTSILALVYPPKTISEQLALFQKLGTQRTNISKPDLFVAEAKCGRQPAKAILDTLKRLGFKIGATFARGMAISINVAQFGWITADVNVLELALADIKNTNWGTSKKTNMPHVTAICAIRKKNPDLDQKRLRKVMNETNVLGVAGEATRLAHDNGVVFVRSRYIAPYIAWVLVNQYNKGLLASKRLSETSIFDADLSDYHVYEPKVPRTRLVASGDGI